MAADSLHVSQWPLFRTTFVSYLTSVLYLQVGVQCTDDLCTDNVMDEIIMLMKCHIPQITFLIMLGPLNATSTAILCSCQRISKMGGLLCWLRDRTRAQLM